MSKIKSDKPGTRLNTIPIQIIGFIDGAIINGMINQLSVNGKPIDAAMSEFDESTGGIKWLQIPYPTGEKSIKVTVENIDILVNGPWKLEIPVKPGVN
ncbi:hypothetical protein [Desulfitobacterium sp. AusDCA]|uniref:hypothetical protein n=1 Tax=Desulfitobacterium sp. AusDCA TaxID=3240383 RepID=UPI003DA6F6EA